MPSRSALAVDCGHPNHDPATVRGEHTRASGRGASREASSRIKQRQNQARHFTKSLCEVLMDLNMGLISGRSRRGPRVVAPFEATTRVNVEPASRSDEVNRPEDAVEDAHTGGSKRATSEEHEHGACGMGLGLGLRLRLGLEHEHEHVGDGSWVGEGHTVSRWNVLKVRAGVGATK